MLTSELLVFYSIYLAKEFQNGATKYNCESILCQYYIEIAPFYKAATMEKPGAHVSESQFNTCVLLISSTTEVMF